MNSVLLLLLLFSLRLYLTQGTQDMTSRVRGAYFGALVADALSLGTHYEYDAKKIKQYYGVMDKYYAPGEKTGGTTHGVGWGARNYHGGNGRGAPKRAGEQTDYGDYNILVLEVLAKHSNPPHQLRLDELVPMWKKRLQTWRAWMCTQTKATLQQIQSGAPLDQNLGGYSNAMAVRAAAAYAYYDSEADVVAAARTAMFTHRETTAHQGNEFFMRVAFRIIHQGLSSIEAVKEVAKESSPFIQEKVAQGLAKAKEATDPSSQLSKEEYADDLALTSMARLWHVGKTEPIKVGKASPTEGTLPGVVYFLAKYEGDFAAAATANAMVGGDSASRAVALGMVLGAEQGVEGIPAQLRTTLVEWDYSERLLAQLPLLKRYVDGGEL